MTGGLTIRVTGADLDDVELAALTTVLMLAARHAGRSAEQARSRSVARWRTGGRSGPASWRNGAHRIPASVRA